LFSVCPLNKQLYPITQYLELTISFTKAYGSESEASSAGGHERWGGSFEDTVSPSFGYTNTGLRLVSFSKTQADKSNHSWCMEQQTRREATARYMGTKS
jgi:hypothetical protein